MTKKLFYTLSVFILIMTNSCSKEDNTDNSQTVGRKLRMLTIQQKSATEEESTRSILIDKGEGGIYASWEMGDEVSIYNKTYPGGGYATVKAMNSAKLGTFTGEVDCEVNDILRLFYPAVSTDGSVIDDGGTLTLNIASQKGTLEDIQQNYDFNFGEAIVTSVTDNTATADAGQTENLIAICKFTFKYGKDYLKNITDIRINGVASQAIYTLSARNTPELTLATPSTIHVKTDAVDNCVYVALFPGETSPSFTLTTIDKEYQGTLVTTTLVKGCFYDVVVEAECTGDKPKSTDDYVEVCGIKWAKGNLQYDPENGGDEGFVENWRIAPTQWHFVGYDETIAFDPEIKQIKDNFSHGGLGNGAFGYKQSRSSTTEDLCMKLWYETAGTQYETDFAHATLGDVAYWASFGKYRMPRVSDFMYLINNASYQYGYILTPDGFTVYGYLFTTPQGSRTTNYTPIAFNETEIDNGVFLPMASYVMTTYTNNTTTTPSTRTYKTSFQYNIEGQYMSSGPIITTSGLSNAVQGLKMSTNSVTISNLQNYANVGSNAIYKYQYYFYKIRPVLCE